VFFVCHARTAFPLRLGGVPRFNTPKTFFLAARIRQTVLIKVCVPQVHKTRECIVLANQIQKISSPISVCINLYRCRLFCDRCTAIAKKAHVVAAVLAVATCKPRLFRSSVAPHRQSNHRRVIVQGSNVGISGATVSELRGTGAATMDGTFHWCMRFSQAQAHLSSIAYQAVERQRASLGILGSSCRRRQRTAFYSEQWQIS
jgi:hypothetical protein